MAILCFSAEIESVNKIFKPLARARYGSMPLAVPVFVGCEFESHAYYFVLNLNTEGTLLSKSFMIKETHCFSSKNTYSIATWHGESVIDKASKDT